MYVTLGGNLCSDPTVRMTPGGVTVAEFRVAENRRYKDRSGDWQIETSFHHVVSWRQLALHTAASLRKGNRVVITGRLKQDSWTSDTGTRHQRYIVEADDIGLSLRYAEARVSDTETQVDVAEPEYGSDDPMRPFEVTT